jgi:hypothetical protein
LSKSQSVRFTTTSSHCLFSGAGITNTKCQWQFDVTWNDESQLSTLIRESRIHSLIDSFGVVCSQIKLLPPILLLGKSHCEDRSKDKVVAHVMHSHPMMKGTLLNERPIKEVTIVGDIYTRLHFSHV